MRTFLTTTQVKAISSSITVFLVALSASADVSQGAKPDNGSKLGSVSLKNDSTKNTTYVVRWGDTILKIADQTIGNEGNKNLPKRYEFARQIIAINPDLKNPDVLTPGQTLTIPAYESADKRTIAQAPTVQKEPALQTTQTEAPVEPAILPTVQKESALQAIQTEAPVVPTTLPAVVPPPSPVNTEAQSPHGQGKNHSYLFVQPRVSIDEYKTKDISTKKEMENKSGLNPGLNLGYAYAVGGSSHLLAEGGVNYSELNQLYTNGVTLANKVMWLKNFGVGFETALTSSVHLHAMALLTDYLIVVPTKTPKAYAVDNVTMPAADLTLGWHFLHLHSSVFGISASAEYLFDAKKDGVKYKSGLEPAGTLSWETHREAGLTNYRVAFRYQPSAQKSDAIDQHGNHYGLRFTMLFPM